MTSKGDILGVMSPGNRSALMDFFERKRFPAGKDIFREGEKDAAWAILILSGEVLVTKQVKARDKELGRLGPGEIAGEIGLFAPGERTASARAVNDIDTLVVSRKRLDELRDTNIALAYEFVEKIMESVVMRLRKTVSRLEVVYFWLS